MKEFLLISVLLTFLDFKQSHSFSVQKRHVQSPSDLQNALNVLQRKRRRIEGSNLRDRLYGDMSNPYLPYDEYIPYTDEYREEDPDLTDQYVLANVLNTYPADQYGEGNGDNKDSPNDETDKPTIDELKQMFKQIDENDAKQSKNAQDNSDSDDKISQQQMDEMLSEAVKVAPSNTKQSEELSVRTNSPEPVSTDELKDVFKETKTTEKLDQDNKGKLKSISQEYIDSNQGNSPSKKKKRMSKRDNNSDKIVQANIDETLLNLVQENQELRGQLYKLKLIEYLEDKENDNLASALKDATLAQLGNAEGYLQDEYDEIQKALEIEQALQEIKDSDTDEKLDDESEPVDIKRSEPTYEDNLGVWYEQPIVDQGDAQQKLEDFVKQYRQTYDLEDDNGEEGDDILPVEVPVPQTEEDECPQLDLLSSNCEVASLLDIDNEARDLCNRHEICYICGATVGLSRQTCDYGFRSETVERCGSTHCIQSGAEFLWFIKQDHKYTTSYVEQCNASCIKKYIVGV